MGGDVYLCGCLSEFGRRICTWWAVLGGHREEIGGWYMNKEYVNVCQSIHLHILV